MSLSVANISPNEAVVPDVKVDGLQDNLENVPPASIWKDKACNVVSSLNDEKIGEKNIVSQPIATTVIGSFPKPEYLGLPDWFKTGTGTDQDKATRAYSEMQANWTQEDRDKLEENIMRATKEVIDIQTQCGVNIVTDGEIRRENYIHYLCRFIEGIDFENLTERECRGGAYKTGLPTIRGKVSWRGPLDVVAEWKKAQSVSSAPVKYTLPGPMTIMGTVHNAFYESEVELAADLAAVVNKHVRDLANAGCYYIQIDEPVFARHPEKALDWGIKMLDECFKGVGKECEKQVHICCGYPEYLDQHHYKKADATAYAQLAPALDKSVIDAVSIEDAHRHNDLQFLESFKNTKVIFGLVQSANSRIETEEEITSRLDAALNHIKPDQLVAAPDCGLGLLPLPILKRKLINMCSAADKCRCKRARTD